MIRGAARTVQPAVKLDVVKEDPDDNKILKCAVTAGSEYIVTVCCSVKLLFDEMLAPSLANRLADLFQESEHVRTLGMKQTPDPDVWHRAKTLHQR